MSAARRELLDLLAAQGGPVTVAALAAQTDQRPNTVREHLDGLVSDGLATRTRATVNGRGRPPWAYEYTDAIGLEHGNEYGALAVALAQHIERTSTAPFRDAVSAGEAWGRAMLHPDKAKSTRAKRRKVIESLDTLGFAPEPTAELDGAKLTRCPLLAAARRSPAVVCGVHQGLLRVAMAAQGLAPDDVRLYPFVEPGCCVVTLDTP